MCAVSVSSSEVSAENSASCEPWSGEVVCESCGCVCVIGPLVFVSARSRFGAKKQTRNPSSNADEIYITNKREKAAENLAFEPLSLNGNGYETSNKRPVE